MENKNKNQPQRGSKSGANDKEALEKQDVRGKTTGASSKSSAKKSVGSKARPRRARSGVAVDSATKGAIIKTVQDTPKEVGDLPVNGEEKKKIRKLLAKKENQETKFNAVDGEIKELKKAAEEIEIDLVGMIKGGADKKVKKTLKERLKKILKILKVKNKKREKVGKKIEKKKKAIRKVKNSINTDKKKPG